MYEKIYSVLKKVLNVFGILFKTILKIRNSCFQENFYSKNCRMLPVFDKLLGYFWGERKFCTIYEDISCGNLKKKKVIYHNEGERIIIGLFLW